MLGVLPNQGKDDTYDLVIRPSFSSAILARGSALSATDGSKILATIEANKTNRMVTFFTQYAEQKAKLSAQHAEQKAKVSAQRAEHMAKVISLVVQSNAQRAEQKAKLSAQLSAQRSAQLRAFVDDVARLRQQGRIPRAQHPASRVAFVKGFSIAASLAAAGVGLVMWDRSEMARTYTHGTSVLK